MTATSSVEIPPSDGRYYQHGWQSWSTTGWRPRRDPVRYPVIAEHRLQATDPAHLDDPLPGGSGVGAVELGPSRVALLGALDVDAWVSAHPTQMSGAGTDDWYSAEGSELEVFADYAAALETRLGARTGSPGSIWCSWYSFYRDVSELDLRKVLTDLDDLPFAVFQIDDGWQRGNGDWAPNDRFGEGMAPLAERIAASGRTPGLWLAPFLVDADSDLHHHHPEMLLRDAEGDPVLAAKNWDRETFALDATNPITLEWLDELIRAVVGWGYRYLKLDFLYAAALPRAAGDLRAREAAYRRAAEVIRNAAGDDVYLLACGAPILASIGIFDAIRIGPDVAPYWDNEDRTLHLADRAGPGAADAITTSLGRFWLRSLIAIDPDVTYFRSRHSLLTRRQRDRLTDLAHICDFRATSDPPEWLSRRERADLETFLNVRPKVHQVDRYRFLLDDREVDFTDIVEARPW